MKKSIKVIIFLIITFVVIVNANYVLRNKSTWGYRVLQQMHTLPDDTVDVVFLGSSHVYCDINPSVFWDQYGITGFDLSGSSQTIWNSYYYLKEILKTQSPKLVVFDTYPMVYKYEYGSSEGKVIENILGLELSKNKIEALRAGAEKEEHLNLLLQFPLFHSRYSELEERDFDDSLLFNNMYMGYNSKWKRTVVGQREHNTEECAPIYEKNMEYLQKIVELCEKENIEILLVTTPYILSKQDMQIYNSIANYAEENGIKYINYCKDDKFELLGLDFELDFSDASHLNYWGSIKFSNKLAEDICETYSFEDKRGKEEYVMWEESSQLLKQDRDNHVIAEETDLNNYLKMIQDTRYYCVIVGNSEQLIEINAKYGWINELQHSNDALKAIILNNEEVELVTAGNYYSVEFEKKDLSLIAGNDNEDSKVYFREQQQLADNDYIKIVIIDGVLEKVVDNVSVNENWEIIRSLN